MNLCRSQKIHSSTFHEHNKMKCDINGIYVYHNILHVHWLFLVLYYCAFSSRTATSVQLTQTSRQWLKDHFPNWFKGLKYFRLTHTAPVSSDDRVCFLELRFYFTVTTESMQLKCSVWIGQFVLCPPDGFSVCGIVPEVGELKTT